MPAMIVKTKAQMALLAEMIQDGSTRREVAKEFGCSDNAVKGAMRRWNSCHRRGEWLKFHRTSMIDVALRERMLLLVGQGCRNCAEVARRMSRDPSLVQRWMHALIASGALRRTGTGKGTRLSVAGIRVYGGRVDRPSLLDDDDANDEPWAPCWDEEVTPKLKKPPQARCQKVLMARRGVP